MQQHKQPYKEDASPVEDVECPLVPSMFETPNNLNPQPFGAVLFYYYSNLD